MRITDDDPYRFHCPRPKQSSSQPGLVKSLIEPRFWEEQHGECDDEAKLYDSYDGDGAAWRSVNSAQDPLGHCHSPLHRLQEGAQEW